MTKNKSHHAHPKDEHDKKQPHKPPGAPDRTPVKEPDRKIPTRDPKTPDKEKTRL